MKTYGSKPEMNNEERYTVTDENLLTHSDAYPVMDVAAVPVQLNTVHDFASGGKRKRRYGLMISIGGIPNLSEMDDPILVDANMPRRLLDADTLDTLRERAHAELDAMFNLFEDAASGKLEDIVEELREELEKEIEDDEQES